MLVNIYVKQRTKEITEILKNKINIKVDRESILFLKFADFSSFGQHRKLFEKSI